MPRVSVCSYNEIYAEDTEPNANLLASIQHAEERATQIMGVPLARKGLKVSENSVWQDMQGVVTAGRQVGTKDIAIIVDVQSLYSHFAALDKRVVALSTSKVRNVAAQVLVIACGGGALLPSTSSTWYEEMAANEPAALQVLAGQMEVTVGVLVKQADNIISRRNKAIHHSSLVDLDMEVDECLTLGTPGVRAAMHWEFRVLDQYDFIKVSFPSRFVGV
jgi:hypothetical protein